MAFGDLEGPDPDLPLGTAMLARVPLAIALDTGAIDEQAQWALRPSIWDVHGKRFIATNQGA